MRNLIIATIVAVLFAAPAFAACLDPERSIGTVVYNPDYNFFQGCTERGWVAFHAPPAVDCSLDGQNVAHGDSWTFYSAEEHANCASISQSRTCTDGTLDGSASYQYASCEPPAADPCETGPIGTVCTSDGAVYAGETVGPARFYVAAADQGGTHEWKTSLTTTTGTGSTSNGLANTDAMETAGLAAHPAGQACRNRPGDWYLPAIDELGTLYSNRAQLGAANLPTSASWYWSSSQIDTLSARIQRFSVGTQSNDLKSNVNLVRCVRR